MIFTARCNGQSNVIFQKLLLPKQNEQHRLLNIRQLTISLSMYFILKIQLLCCILLFCISSIRKKTRIDFYHYHHQPVFRTAGPSFYHNMSECVFCGVRPTTALTEWTFWFVPRSSPRHVIISLYTLFIEINPRKAQLTYDGRVFQRGECRF